MRSYFKSLAGRDRSERSDRHLAFLLTLIAGAANAGGFMAVHQYTSHMSGIVSSLADNLVIGNLVLFLHGFAGLVAFILGAASSAILINWARRRDLYSQYALPLALEAVLLLAFAGSDLLPEGSALHSAIAIIMLLCYVMGLQNAMITKLSGARIRTTHVTGMVTDIGIELGKALYRNPPHPGPTSPAPVVADRAKLGLLASLVSLFFSGGVFGALLFARFGVAAGLILALPLVVIVSYPLLTDMKVKRVH